MAFDQSTRNRLQKFVNDARNLLTEEFNRQLQATYGLDPKAGSVAAVDSLTHLDNRQRQTANVLRDTLAHYLATTHGKGEKDRTKQALSRIVREQAFTVLNRLAALRMAEARGFLLETIAKGYNAKGFQLYKQLAGSALGETGEAYRDYLYSVFDEFSLDLAVLFDRHSAQGRLFPRESALLELLDLINHHEIEPLWAEDETIGWIYQYFNSQEERKKMRAESQAPRNSRELAVRNQFFTPRYVVEFLTDNTLGRIWYEMTQGKTSLIDSCRYLVRRPTEVFLKPGELAPEQEKDAGEAEALSQEELLKKPVYIPHRAIKDPRCIRMLDPACGSMHFGLYAFDLYERIYEEAWQLEAELGAEKFIREGDLKPLQQTYDSFESYRSEIPRLIIENNIHGVDIDPRAVQIAGLSLWQRAQRAWQQQGIKPQQRPVVRKSNIVCAEPMPGEKAFLQEFSTSLNPPVLGQLLEGIFDKMELAGEAGTLLKIEKEIQSSIHEARDQWQAQSGSHSVGDMFQAELDQATSQKKLVFDLSGVDDESFWDGAEQLFLDALSNYAGKAESNADQKRLFAEDAAKGFAFIDLCRKRFDTVLMNPPFGACSPKSKSALKAVYPETWTDLYSAFIARALNLLSTAGMAAAITSNLWLNIKRQSGLREAATGKFRLCLVADLGGGVLDTATVDTALSVIENRHATREDAVGFYIARDQDADRDEILLNSSPQYVRLGTFSDIPSSPFCFDLGAERISLWNKTEARLDPNLALTFKGNGTFDNFRFLRSFWEIDSEDIDADWIRYDKGGIFQPFFNPSSLVWRFKERARENRVFQIGLSGTDAQVNQSSKHWLKSGICYSRATSIGFSPRLLCSNHVVNDKSIAIIPRSIEDTMGLLALLSSTHVQDLLYAFGYHRNIEKGAVASLPLDRNLISESLCNAGIEATQCMMALESSIETSPVFVRPAFKEERKSFISNILDQLFLIDQEVLSGLYGNDCQFETLSEAKSSLVAKSLSKRFSERGNRLEKDWVSFIIGLLFGRWKNDDLSCLPNVSEQYMAGISLPKNQPVISTVIEIDESTLLSASGVASLDEVKDAIDKVLPELPFDIEFDYLTWIEKGFFADHIDLYSESGRVSPIYWPLQTPSGSYTLWLFYHRLNEETLYACVNDFVQPKFEKVEQDLNTLRGKSARSTKEEKELEKLSDLASELRDFRDELLRLAKFWIPNLNDGVQITAAPLWKLFQHKVWQKKLKDTWESLENGDYDWAHLACSIWPERVLRKCHQDRSLAIAHDVEDAFWHEVEVPVMRGKKPTGETKLEWQPKELTDNELDALIQAKIKERRA